MMMRLSFLVPTALCFFLQLLRPVVSGDNLHVGSNHTHMLPEDLMLCADDDDPLNCTGLRRFCVDNTTSGDKACGPCLNGTIDHLVGEHAVEGGLCMHVDEITVQHFEEAFGDAIELERINIEERLSIIMHVATFISTHNAKFPHYTLKLNALAALTPEELAARNGAQDSTADEEGLMFLSDIEPERRQLEDIPEKIDWTEMNAVTDVKNQGHCGGCWAFSIAGALEGAAAISSNFTYLDSSSPQQLLSCDDKQLGCKGGNVITGMQYTTDNRFGGVTPLDVVPFTDSNGNTTEPCPVTTSDPIAVTVTKAALAVSSTRPSDPDERVLEMKRALTKQPMVVLMNATCPTIQSYSSGIITDDGLCACSSGECVDHAVLMVGYDDTSDPPSFKIKNSWGTGWGESGYFQISQTVNNDTQPFGLFGLLYQASTGVGVTNSTAAIPTSAAATAHVTWMPLIVVNVIVGLYSALVWS